MKIKIQYKIAFFIFIVGGIVLLKNFGLYFVLSIPILITFYIIAIKMVQKK